MTAARKAVAREYAPGEREAEDVRAVCSTDPARTRQLTPFGAAIRGRGMICGTDGHRAHLVVSEASSAYYRSDAPPVEQIVPWDAPRVGEICFRELDDARVFPAKWDVKLDVQPHALLAHVSVERGKSKGAARPFGFDGVRVGWFKLDSLRFSFGMQLDYLLDAVDFCGTNVVTVWGSEPLAPIAFTCGTKTIADSGRIAVVMPMHI